MRPTILLSMPCPGIINSYPLLSILRSSEVHWNEKRAWYCVRTMSFVSKNSRMIVEEMHIMCELFMAVDWGFSLSICFVIVTNYVDPLNIVS